MYASEKRSGLVRKPRPEITQLCQQQLKIMSRQLDILYATPVLEASVLAASTPEQRRMSPLVSSSGGPVAVQRSQPISTSQAEIPAVTTRILPLSEEQKELWFMSLAEESASQAYNQALSIRLLGALKVPVLEEALQALIQRHEALRTTFERKSPQQKIFSSLPIRMEYTDLASLGSQEQERVVAQFQENVAQKAFDLEHGPLLRAHLLKLAEDTHLFLFSLHHIIADGRSFGTLLNELTILYEAKSTGMAQTLAVPISYSYYIQQQATLAQSAEMVEAEQYWLSRFAETPPALDFPLDYQRPPVKTFQGAKLHVALPRELTKELKRVGLAHKCTLYTTMFAAYTTFLSHVTGQRDLVVPISSAGQFFVDGGEGLVGHCVKLLPIRLTLPEDESLSEYLHMVKQAVFEAQEHQCYPFAELIQKLALPRDPSRVPLVATDFNLDVAGNLQFHGLETQVQSTDSHFAQFDFSLNITQAQDELQLEYTYNTDLFAPETIERWADYFRMLLQNMVQARTLADLMLLDSVETQRFVRLQQRLEENYPPEHTFMDMFAEQVRSIPDTIAAACELEQITYADLNERAELLARQLARRGVTRETLVVVLMERSIDFLVSVLAIFKAGGAYLPLNTHWPEIQYTRVLESCQSQHILTTAGYLPKLDTALAPMTEGHHIQMHLLEDLVREEENTQIILPGCSPDSLAYVIYTSGSTGLPKGAMIEHRGMLNHLYAKKQELGLQSNDCIAQNASQSFDISIWQFLACLVNGGHVQIIPDAFINDPLLLLEQVRYYGISVLEIVPSLLQGLFLLIEASGHHKPEAGDLRWLISTGEALPPSLARQWLRSYAHVPLMNGYGPTECSDDVTHYVLTTPPSESLVQVPIGHRLANLELYVLDADMRLLPPGIPGELYVGGVGVGRGYVRDPITTATTFVPHPFHTEPGRRLYKTGDRVRITSAGNVEFFGRLDHQVKIRGFRIELGEIEANLYRHSSVQDTTVVVREDEVGEKRLVAYVVSHAEESGQANILRNWLREQGPEYMVPSAFVFLERLPLTPNGKIDLRALPAPVQEPMREDGIGGPRTALERLLAQAWQDVLHKEIVSIHDNFFELGGDSIMSIKIIARLHDAGLKLTTREIFQHQTIAELAQVVAQSPGFSTEQGVITGEVPLTPVQRTFFEMDIANVHHYNQALWLEVHEALDLDVLQASLRYLIHYHDGLRSRFEQRDSVWQCQIVRDDREAAIEYRDLSVFSEARQQVALEQIAIEVQASLNITHGPLIRFVYCERGAQHTGRLLIVAHHLVIDAVSWEILIEDLQRVYQQGKQGIRLELPPKTSSFKSWAEHLTDYGRSEQLGNEKSFWLTRPWHEVSVVPKDIIDGKNGREALSTVKVELSEDETRSLLQDLSKIYHCQINDVLLTALLESYARWTGHTTLLLDLEGHGREELFEDVSVTRTLGWFTSVTPLLLQLPEEHTAMTAVQAVRTQRQQIPNNGIGFGVLRYYGPDTQEIVSLPQAQISFNYLGQAGQAGHADTLFSPTPESYGATVGQGGSLPYLIDIVSKVENNVFSCYWIYSQESYQKETIERLASWYRAALQRLISESAGISSYDTSLVDLDSQTLNRLLEKVRFSDGQS